MKSYRPSRTILVGEYLADRLRCWVPGHELATPQVGGSSGLRRLRELREAGFDIQGRQMTGSFAWEYRLMGFSE